MLKNRRRKPGQKPGQTNNSVALSGSSVDDESRESNLCADVANLTNGNSDPMCEALKVATAACNAHDLALKCRQESRLIGHLALKARLRADNVASLTKELNETALKATEAAVRLQGFRSVEQACQETPECQSVAQLQPMSKESDDVEAVDGGLTPSRRPSMFRGFNLSEIRRKLDGLTGSKTLKRMKKYNCSERPKSTPLPPPKQQGLEVFPTVSKDPKEFLEEYFDVVQSIDPIWEDAYYDEMGKMHIHTVYNSSYRERKEMRQFQMRLRQSLAEEDKK